MKQFNFLMLIVLSIFLNSCSQAGGDKVQKSIQSYLKEKLKNPTSYESMSFDSLRTLKTPDTLLTNGKVFYYTMFHRYRVKNSDGVGVPMSVEFAFDKDMNIIATAPVNIDGDYTSIKGTVAVGGYKPEDQKPDFNAEIVFFPTDSIRKALTFETTTDMQGNFNLERILPGQYIVVVRSGNLPFCPTNFIFSGSKYEKGSYSENAELIKRIAGFDYRQLAGFSQVEEKEISTNQLTANLTGARTPESDKLREDRYNARLGFDQECFNFYKSFQSKLPSVFYQTDLEYSNAIKFESWVDVEEEKGQTRNFVVSDGCW